MSPTDLAKRAFQAFEAIAERDLPRRWEKLAPSQKGRWEAVVKVIQTPPVEKTVAERTRIALSSLEDWFTGVNKVEAGDYPHEIMTRALKANGFNPDDADWHRVRESMEASWDRWCHEVEEEDGAEGTS